jgi:heat shock protein HtpX
MLLTLLLIGLLHAGVVVVLLLVIPRAWWPVAATVAGVLFLAEFWFGDRLSAIGTGAREADFGDAPELHATLDRLCALIGVPKPAVALIDTDVPNAFAAGRTYEHAVVFVTTGLVRRLSPEELEAVLAHELSHIAHRDAMVMTAAGFLGLLAGAVTRGGLDVGYWDGWDGAEDSLLGVSWLLVAAAGSVVYGVSFLLTRTLSRYRELSADRAAAQLTGRPSVLASALVKVHDEVAAIPTRDLRLGRALSAFSFVPLGAGPRSVGRILCSHPTLQERLDQLQRMSRALNQP